MANKYLSEDLEEAFFDRYFVCSDDTDTNIANVKKAIRIMKTAYSNAEKLASAVEDGECFDESEAVLVYQTLALAKLFFEQFVSLFSEEEQEPYRRAVTDILK